MKKILAVFLFLITPAVAAGASAPSNPGLRDELLAMQARDQELRHAAESDASKMPAVMEADRAHTARMKEIVAEFGWPTASLAGEDGASAAWLLVQHADADPDFQRKALLLMEPLLDSGEISKREYAYLWDRTHEPQRYGTQLHCVDGRFQPREIESPEEVDARRKAMGMVPLADYVRTAREFLADAEAEHCKGAAGAE